MPFASSSSGKSKGSSRWGGSSSASSGNKDTGKVDKSIANARKRITDSGYQVNVDHRNWFEKATNLPEGQNALLDTLDLLGRPQQALYGGIMNGSLEGAAKGFTGKEHTTGAEILGDLGVDNKYLKAIGGTALDIVADPINFIPGGAIVKGATKVGDAGKAAYQAVEKAAPILKTAREKVSEKVTEPLAQGAKKMFTYQGGWDETLDGGKSDALKNLYNDTDNRMKFEIENSSRDVINKAKVTGLEAGNDMSRIMEKDLKISKDAQELLNGILKGQPVKVNIKDGELQELVDKMNDHILNSPVVKERIGAKSEQLANVSTRLDDLGKKFDIEDIRARDEAGDQLTKQEQSALIRHDKYTTAQGKLQKDIADTKRGMNFNPLDTAAQRSKGEGFELVNPSRQVYKKALGDQRQFLDNISPKKSVDEVFKPELAPTLVPVAKKLLEEGKAVIPQNIKGTPEAAELKRVFGSDISMVGKKNTTVTLRNPEKYQGDNVKLTDRIENVNIKRPERELSDSPLLHVTAKQLMESNDEIRQAAEASGITIPEIEGYMTHILTKDARDAMKKAKAQSGNAGLGQPNKNVVKQRKYDGSVEDINELVDREQFNPNAYFATAIGQKRLIEYIRAESFKRQVLSDTKFAKPYKKGDAIPDNAVVINPDQYKFFKVSTPDGNEYLGLSKGQEYIVTKGAKEALDRLNRAFTDEGINTFLKSLDWAQTTWKKLALFSVPFHIRNAVGSLFNSYVGGMNTIDLAKYTKEGYETVVKEILRERKGAIVGPEDALYREYRRQGLSSSNLSKVEFKTHGDPEKDIEDIIKDKSRSLGQQVNARINPLSTNAKHAFVNWEAVKNVFQTSREVGDFMDQSHRFALFKWAVEKKNMNHAQAAAKVREVLFDYTRTTNTEREILSRMFPFYRWMRFNMPFQIKQFINDPRKYTRVDKIRTNFQDAMGIDDEETPDFLKSQFAIPVSEKKFLSLGLPLGDLGKLGNPLQTFTDSVTPLIKTPLELATNFNMFYKKPIEQFAGQKKQLNVLGADVNIPIKAAYAAEAATGQIGRGLSQYFQKPEDVNQDTKFRTPKLGISGILKPYDKEKSQYYEHYEELRKLQDAIDYIEQQTGVRPRTMQEINKKK